MATHTMALAKTNAVLVLQLPRQDPSPRRFLGLGHRRLTRRWSLRFVAEECDRHGLRRDRARLGRARIIEEAALDLNLWSVVVVRHHARIGYPPTMVEATTLPRSDAAQLGALGFG
jgi:hypothetical protein